MNDQQKEDSNGDLLPTETMETKKETTPPKEVVAEQKQESKASSNDGVNLATTDDSTTPAVATTTTTTNKVDDSSKKPSPPNLAPQPSTTAATAASAAAAATMRDLDIAQRELNLLAQQNQLLRFAQQQQQQMAAFAGGGGGAGFHNPFEQLYAAQQGLPTSLESMAAFQAQQQQQQHFARMSGLMGFPPRMMNNNPYLDPMFPTGSSSSAAAMMPPFSSSMYSDNAMAMQGGAAAAAALMKQHPLAKATMSSSKHGPILIMKQKPKRPLSAYNLFFKDQRAKMNEELAYAEEHGGEEKKEDDDDDEIVPTEDVPDDNITSGDKRKMGHNKAGSKKKQKKVGFADLAKTIGPLWKTLDAKTLEHYQALAEKEKERYRQECSAYQRYQEREWEAQQKNLEATIDDSAKQRYFLSNKFV